MRKVVLYFIFSNLFILAFSQIHPIAHELAQSPFYFNQWSPESVAGTFPEAMTFLQYDIDYEPEEKTEPSQLWMCNYNIDSRSRFIGLGIDGIGFLNTGDVQDNSTRCGNENFTGSKVGVVVLALNTNEMQDIELVWKIRLLEQGSGLPQPREFRVKAQYRLDSAGAWTDFPSATLFSSSRRVKGDVQEYKVSLPTNLENREYVQIRWKYFEENSNQGGSRPLIALDDIKVYGMNVNTGYTPYVFVGNENIGTFGCIDGDTSAVDSIIVSAIYIRDELSISVGGGFFISLDKNGTYSQKVNLMAEDRNINETTIYLKKACSGTNVEVQNVTFRAYGLLKRFRIVGEGYYKMYINELVSSNFLSYYDPRTKDYPDWIEIYNPNEESVNIGGFYLSDDIDNLKKFYIAPRGVNTISPKGFNLYFGDNSAISPEHLNFSLSLYGETIYLVGKNGNTIIDSVTYPKIPSDYSYGREQDGMSNWVVFNKPTPLKSNSSSKPTPEKSSPPIFSKNSGWYDYPFSLELSSLNPDAKIYYTLDGSDPNAENLGGFVFEYKQSYNITKGIFYIGDSYYRAYRTSLYFEPIDLSKFRTKDFWMSDINAQYTLVPFKSAVKRDFANAIRAIAVEPGKSPSDIITQTYFFENDDPVKDSLPIIAITLNEEDLKGFYNGIGVPGTDYETWRNNSDKITTGLSPANYNRKGKKSEIPANIEIFENQISLLNQDVGIRLNGATSRSIRHKSFRLYPRNLYGKDKIMYAFFKNLPYEDYKRLILRNSGADFYITMFKDAFCQGLMKNTLMDYQEYQPYNVYINGEYFGFLNARERLDINYLNRKYGFDDQNVDFLENYKSPINGDNINYSKLLEIVENDTMMSDESYFELNKMMDMDNYVDYQSFEIFVANMDWPYNNIRYWRYKNSEFDPEAPYGLDGRWRWMIFDLDNAFKIQYVNFNSLENALYPVLNIGAIWAQFLFRSLNRNVLFRNKFITRYSDLLNTTFLTSRIEKEIDYYQNLLNHDMPNFINRWNVFNNDINKWYSNIEDLRKFANERPANCRNHMKIMFDLKDLSEVSLSVNDIQMGHIKLNTIEIDKNTPGIDTSIIYPWKGLYFNDLPITFIPIPEPGYKFSHWETLDSTSTIDTLVFDLKNNFHIKAYFEVDPNYVYNPEAAIITDCPYKFNDWPSQASRGTYPENMAFYYTRYPDSRANGEVDGRLENIAYDYDSKTRINGLGSLGLSLINTGSANRNYYQTRLGAVAVAVNTENIPAAEALFTLGTINPQSKKYSIRLQYRLSDRGQFIDFLDESGNFVEYKGSPNADDEQRFRVNFPKELLNQKYVQLVWRYYYNGEQIDMSTDARDELRIDDIVIKQKEIVDVQPKDTYSNILVGNPNGKNFQWFKCVGDSIVKLENETKKDLIITVPGNYALAVDYPTCSDTSECSYFYVKEHKLFEPSIHTTIYPNPNNGVFDLTFDEPLKNVKIKIYDVLGNQMDEFEYDEIQKISYNFAKWASGAYILDIATLDGKRASQKVIIQ